MIEQPPAVRRVNAALATACAVHDNLMVVDEEAIASTIGKHRVLYDLHDAYSHHGHGYTSQTELATIAIGPRNQPARSLFRDAGFTAEPDGSFVLRRARDLVAPDPAIHHITCAVRDVAAPACEVT